MQNHLSSVVDAKEKEISGIRGLQIIQLETAIQVMIDLF